MLGGIGGAYALANVAASAQVAAQEQNLLDLLLLPVVFAGAHLAYGLGSLWVLAQVLAQAGLRPLKSMANSKKKKSGQEQRQEIYPKVALIG